MVSDLSCTDEELLRRMAHGKASAFNEFYHRHSTTLYSLVVHMIGDEPSAETVFESAMIGIWEQAGSYDPASGRPLSWAVQRTRRDVIEWLRVHGWQAGPPKLCFQDRGRNAAHPAFAALAAGHNQVMALAFLGGLTHREIAARLGQPLESVTAQLRSGMLSLRGALDNRS